jgi:hypothetical protein
MFLRDRGTDNLANSSCPSSGLRERPCERSHSGMRKERRKNIERYDNIT